METMAKRALHRRSQLFLLRLYHLLTRGFVRTASAETLLASPAIKPGLDGGSYYLNELRSREASGGDRHHLLQKRGSTSDRIAGCSGRQQWSQQQGNASKQ